jgi:hypothetical protein
VKAAGAQVANVRLTTPIVVPGAPVQASGLVLPADGIALVIGTDRDHKLARQVPILTPPLSYPKDWIRGSSTGDDPSMDTAWFHAEPGGQVFIATVKIVPTAWQEHADIAAVTRMIETLSF